MILYLYIYIYLFIYYIYIDYIYIFLHCIYDKPLYVHKKTELFAKWISGSICCCLFVSFWSSENWCMFSCLFVVILHDPLVLILACTRDAARGKKWKGCQARQECENVCSMFHRFPISSLSGFLVDPCCHHIRFPCSCHLTRSRSAKHKRRGDLSSDTKGRAKSTRINPWDHSTCQVGVVRFYHSCSPPPPPPFPPPSGPTLQGSERTGHRWTSTWHLPSSVRTAGPQPGTVRAQWAPLDLNLGPSELSGHRWTST